MGRWRLRDAELEEVEHRRGSVWLLLKAQGAPASDALRISRPNPYAETGSILVGGVDVIDAVHQAVVLEEDGHRLELASVLWHALQADAGTERHRRQGRTNEARPGTETQRGGSHPQSVRHGGGDVANNGIIEEDKEVTDMSQHGDREHARSEIEAARNRIADLADAQARPVTMGDEDGTMPLVEVLGGVHH
ncbi:hypothetical protein ACQJBY_043725 [Aegilops geniculata]